MKHKKRVLENISPEHRLTVEQKLNKKGIKFLQIPLVRYGKRMGVNCPKLHKTLVKHITIQRNTFIIKQHCKNCKRWLGGEGKYYFCKIK